MKKFFEMPRPTVSFEVVQSGNSDNLGEIYSTVDFLAALKPDMISVTYNGTPLIASQIQNDYDVNSIAHITCKGNTKTSIRDTLDKLKETHVRNILVARGNVFDKYEGKSEFKHSSELIEFIRQEYYDDFDIFAVFYPGGHVESYSSSTDMGHLKTKYKLGVKAFISQLFFDNDEFCQWCELARLMGIDCPILAGIMPVTSPKQLEKMVTMCGAKVPERVTRFVRAFSSNPDTLIDAGIAYTTRQIVDLFTRGVDGIHLYAMNKPDVVRRIDKNIQSGIK